MTALRWVARIIDSEGNDGDGILRYALSFAVSFMSFLLPAIAFAATFFEDTLRNHTFSGRVQPENGNAYYLELTFNEPGKGLLRVYNNEFECSGTLFLESDHRKGSDFRYAYDGKGDCAKDGTVQLWANDNGSVGYQYQQEIVKNGYSVTTAVLTQSGTEGLDDTSISVDLPELGSSTKGVDISDVDFWDYLALVLWIRGDAEYISDNIPVLQMDDKFEEKRYHERLITDLQEKLSSLKMQYSEFNFQFIDLSVDVGEFDFDTNTQTFCVPRMVGIGSPYDLTKPFLKVFWKGSDAIGGCDGTRTEFAYGNSVSNGHSLRVQLDSRDQGENFDRIIRSGGVKISFYCAGTEALGYSGFELACVPYDTRLTTKNGQLLYSQSWSNGAWVESNPFRKD